MHGTDEVWVAAVEETLIAFGEFGHDGAVKVLVCVEFPKNSGVGGDRTRVKTSLLYPHQG
jgi:hypothetical protein